VLSELTEGTVVRRGDVVGILGTADMLGKVHCDSACLHFGVRLHGQYVSPLNYLGGVARSILLPTRGFR
jgi:murein DD-endopeptidase MepM/ murein hydrolase activator NlpD